MLKITSVTSADITKPYVESTEQTWRDDIDTPVGEDEGDLSLGLIDGSLATIAIFLNHGVRSFMVLNMQVGTNAQYYTKGTKKVITLARLNQP
ncbi:MAG: hypothetical protein V5786_05770 [Psychromonas sp.]